MWPTMEPEMTLPVTGSSVAVPRPVNTNTRGTPSTAASAAVRSSGSGPAATTVTVRPSALTVVFAGPEVLVVTLLPFAGFVHVICARLAHRAWCAYRRLPG